MTAPADQPSASRGTRGAVALALVLIGLVAYANSFDGEFVWDDASSILLHRHVKDPGKVLALFTEDQHAFAGGQGNFYRPLLSVTFMIDYAVARIGQEPVPPESVPDDLSPTVFHLSSVLWHCAAGVLLYLFMARVGAPTVVQIAVPAVFLAHPLHTEAVAYISGRADSMAAAFMFAGLYFATWRETPRRFWTGTALALVCFAGGLLSKESAFIFPALLALYLFMLRPGGAGVPTPAAQRFVPLTGSLALLGVYAALRTTVLNFGSDTTPPDTGFFARVVEMLQAFALYLKLFFLPTGLHMERTLNGVPNYVAGIGAVLLVALAAMTIYTWGRGERRAAFAFAWFFATWLPISGLFPLNAPMAEHWMYVPMAGFFWGLAEFIVARLGGEDRIAQRPVAQVLGAVVTIWALALLLLTVDRNRDWDTNESLYTATLRENPNSVRVHFNLAVTYQDLLDNPAGARRHYHAVVRAYEARREGTPELAGRFWRDELEAHLSLGELYREAGRFGESLPHYQYVLQAEPGENNRGLVAQAAFGAGQSLLALGNYRAALEQFQQAVHLVPSLAPEADRVLTNEAPLAPFTALDQRAPNQGL